MPARGKRGRSDLFYDLKMLGTLARLLLRACRVDVRRLDRRCGRMKRGHGIRWNRECKAIARFLCEHTGDRGNRDGDLLRRTVEARGELHPIVVDRQTARRATA